MQTNSFFQYLSHFDLYVHLNLCAVQSKGAGFPQKKGRWRSALVY
jgi:hypothetical protein